MAIHRSALKHGLSIHAIDHAYAVPIAVVDLDPDADPPRLLIIGPGLDGNLLELIVLVLASDELLIIHAMPLRPAFFRFLPDPTE